jgi:hypothetical protein
MQSNDTDLVDAPALTRWLRFLLAASLLALFVLFFASGYSPPGIAGEVLRHNQENNIDASPLLYSDVEHMDRLEAGVAELRARARGVDGDD